MLLSACLDYTQEEDICPNCGDLAELDSVTGWCATCSKAHNDSNGLCVDCGVEVPVQSQRKLCWDCKEERWLAKYGDAIEWLMLTGLSFNKAKEMVANAIRPLCVICGGSIKGGTPGESLFCSTTLSCKRARNKYRRLIASGKSPSKALHQVMKRG